MREMLNRLRRRIWTRAWTDEQVRKYVGEYRSVYFTYAADEEIRTRAASGGSVSALLVSLLEKGEIDGAVVLESRVERGRVVPRFVLARTRQEVLRAQGSKYTAVNFPMDAFPLIQSAAGRVAVVALPCDAGILHRYRLRNPDLDAKVALVIALLCGHNSEPALTEGVCAHLGQGHGELQEFTHRRGHWRGFLQAGFADGTQVTQPFSRFSDYQNLYFFAQRKCHYCHDHMGYFCDISAGDIWSDRMRRNPVKHTALIARTPRGEQVIDEALARAVLLGQREEVREVMDGQARTLPFHFNVSARSLAGRAFRERIPDTVAERVRWNEYMVAWFVLFNERLTRSPRGRRLVLRLPRFLLKAYLILLKGLESL